MAIEIGPIRLSDPVILAPLSGITDLPFRRLAKRLGAVLVVSEMIASEAMIRETRQALRQAANEPEEFPMAVQLAGRDPQVMAMAARLNEDRGAAIIDINMGCPAKKVVNGYSGSALMRDERLAARILEATVKAVSLPVTLKMRTGWDDATRNAPDLARIAEESGIRMISVHGRTRCQMYRGRSDWAYIREVKEAVRIPLLVNGDVSSVDEAVEALSLSGADGVMIGRGACGRPWFLGQVAHFLRTGTRLPDPPLTDQAAIVEEHYEGIVELYGTELGVRNARKHLSWYSKSLPNAAAFRDAVNRITDPREVRAFVRQFFATAMDRCSA